MQIQGGLLENNYTDFKTYLEQMDKKYLENWQKNYEKITLSDETKKLLESSSCKINIIAFSGMWCGECAVAIPVLAKMEEESAFIKLYIIDRDNSSTAEVYKQFMPNGDKRVPVLLFTSEDFYLITMWVERPAVKFGMIWHVLKDREKEGIDQIKDNLRKVWSVENDELFRKATIDELSAELTRTLGIVNYSSRSKTNINW